MFHDELAQQRNVVCDNPAPGAYVQCTWLHHFFATGRSESGNYLLAGGSLNAKQENQKHVNETWQPMIAFNV